jgi:outer membrane protein
MRSLPILLVLLATLPVRAERLTFADAIALAKRNHPTVQNQRAQVDIARARANQAMSGFLPNLTGSFQYVPQTANFALTPGFKRILAAGSQSGLDSVVDKAGNTVNVSCAPVGGPCQPAPQASLPPEYNLFNFWQAGVGINWTLVDWGKTYFNWRSARKNETSQKLGVGSAERNVVLDAKIGFLTAAAADAQVGVAEESLKTQQQHATQARAFFEAGTRTKIDVASADSDVANAELTLARAHASADTAHAQLSLALGEDEWHDWQLVVDPNLFALTSEDERHAGTAETAVADEAVNRRSEPRELAIRGDSFKDLLKAARAAYVPALTLQLGPSWAGTELTSLTTNFQITLSIGYPLGGGNPVLYWAQGKEAEANRASLFAQERGIRNQIRQEAIAARAQLIAAKEEVAAARKLIAAATDRRNLAEGRYKTGVGSIIELSDAQLAYVNARFQEVQAGLDVAQARARLQHALSQD